MVSRPGAGFTLLEVMVVVFIIGLLATLVAPRLLGRAEEARRTKAIADMKAIEQALELYRLDSGDYPTTGQGLEALVEKPAIPPIPRNWKPEGYLERVPFDPWGNPYVYVAGGGRFTLRSHGADGVEGGEGRFADLDSRNQ
jgi:general secretion pathway protein G